MNSRMLIFAVVVGCAFALPAQSALKPSIFGFECSFCEALVPFAEKEAAGEGSQVEHALDSICKDLGPLDSACEAFVKSAIDKIVVELKNGKDADVVCRDLGFCNSPVDVVLADAHLKPTIFGFIECEVCEAVVPFAEKELAGEGPTAQKDLDKLCKKFGFLDHECEKLVNEYIPKLVAALKNGAEADTVCKEIGLCSAAKAAVVVAPVEPTTFGKLECGVCKVVVPFAVKEAAGGSKTSKKDLDKACENHGFIAHECKMLVEEYLRKVIHALKEGATADTACHKIGACAAAAVARVEPTTFGAIECEVCKLVVPFAEKEVAGEGPTAQKDLDKACEHFGFLAHECEKLVNEYIPKVVASLKNGVGAGEVCKEIDMCSRMPVKATQLANEFECGLCHGLGPEIEMLLGKEGSVVEKDLDKMCDRTGFFKHECLTLINSNMDKIIAELNNDANKNAADFCRAVGFCSSFAMNFVAQVKQARMAARIQANGGAECYICHLLGPELEKLAGKEEPEIIKELETICDVLGPLRSGCEQWIEKEGATIAKVLSEDEGSGAHELCEKIGACVSTGEIQENAGGAKCLICHFLGPELERLAAQEEPVVAKDLEFVCKLVEFDHSLEQECDREIEKEGAHIAKILSDDSGSNAHELCQKIGWC